MTITLKRTVNLSEPILPEVLPAPLYEGEKNAHTFMITAEKDKLPHALSGSVVAYFERNDGDTVRVEGETKDGAAILTLSPECYQTGVFYLAVMLISDGAQTVIYAASGRVRNTQDGEIIDGGNTIPTYDEIMTHLERYLSTDITAKVEETEDGALITMKDVVNGETTAVVKNGKPGAAGDAGATFRPAVSENGILSWTNDKNLENPEPVNIKGPEGDSVKVSRVSESTEDGGTNVVVFSDGATLRVQNGKTGAPGENGYTPVKNKDYFDGADGFSPTAKVTETPEGALIEITDKDGTTSATVKNGKDGESGSGGTGSFIINVNDDEGTVTVDKTIAEITEAHSAGKTLICALKAKKAIDSTSWHSLESDIPFDRNIGTDHYRFTRFVGTSGMYDDANYIRVVIELDGGETTATINGERYVRKSEVPKVPSVLPNPYGLIINVNGTQTSYDGSRGKTVFIDIPEPVTSLPWSAITDVPFRAGGIAFDDTLTVPMGDGQWPILTPFSIKDGRVYTVTIGENTYENLTAQTTYMEPDVPESKVVFLGNPYFFGGENNNLLFILACFETPLEEAGMFIYGLLMGASEEFMQSSLYVKIDGGETIPLDPELIPTMSETTKGGAKVGKGLKMDGDALTVDEGEYELIEKIIIGYELLTAKPDDWDTNWTAYYKNTGTAKEPVYTLLTDATAPTWKVNSYFRYVDEATTVNRTQETDGTPYNYKCVTIKGTLNKSTGNGANTNYWSGNRQVGYAWWGGKTAEVTQPHYRMDVIEQKNGYWQSYWRDWVTSNDGQLTRYLTRYAVKDSIKDYPSITRIQIIEMLPAGTVIEIWGVRA